MDQTIINIVVGTIMAAGGWWMRMIWDQHQKLSEKQSRFEVQVANEYAKKDDFQTSLDRLEAKIERMFERLFDKLESKQDK